MTVVAPAVAPAPAAPPVVPVPHAGGAGGRAFTAALDALTASDRRASRSLSEGRKPAAEEVPEFESAGPPPDLRAALIGGALASLAVGPARDSEPAAAPSATGGQATPSAPATVATGAPAPPTKAPSGARLTAERSFVAPAAVSSLARGAGFTAAPVDEATQDISSAAIRTAPTSPGAVPANAAVDQSPPRPLSAAAPSAGAAPNEVLDRANTIGLAPGDESPMAIDARPGGAGRTPSASSAVGTPLVAVGVESRRPSASSASVTPSVGAGVKAAPPSPVSSRRAPPSSGREPALARTDASRRASASSSASASDPATGSAACETSTAGGRGESAPPPNAATMIPALSASSGAERAAAAPAQAPAESGPQTALPPAMAQAAGRVREIDLDLAPAALEDVTMTVRLAGDKLGVVIRAASGATATAIEGARDAIAERLAAIGQPLTSLIIQQAGANDATGTAGQSRDGEAPQGWGDFSNQRSARRDPSRS